MALGVETICGEFTCIYDTAVRGLVFELACTRDLEGIVAKRKGDPYLPEHATGLKIRNSNYSQWVGREELSERERGSDQIAELV